MKIKEKCKRKTVLSMYTVVLVHNNNVWYRMTSEIINNEITLYLFPFYILLDHTPWNFIVIWILRGA